MRYDSVDEKQLEGLQPSMSFLDHLFEEEGFSLYLLGLTSDQSIIYDAQDALQDDVEDIDDEGTSGTAHQVHEIALCIPLSSDNLYYLTGSGLKLHNEEFAYIAPGEGARTMIQPKWSQLTRVRLEHFSKMALTTDSVWLDDFMAKYGQQEAAKKPPVTRNNEAVNQHEEESKPEQKSVKAPPQSNNPIDHFLNQ